MEGGVKGDFFKEYQDKNLLTSKTKNVDNMIVPEDTVKYARKNGAAFYFYLRPLKHCKTNRKCERHTSELQLLAC